MKIEKSTRRYEKWLRSKIRVIDEDLTRKHAAMAGDPFAFLRATFYRWAQLWPRVCAKCARAPEVLAVGDLHVENFGTWRDAEGRLVWGVNDFDEAFELPYTFDLVRLAASAHLAIRGAHLRLAAKDACDAILAGYESGLSSGGVPFVLEEHHDWLRSTVSGVLRDPRHFWGKLEALPTLRTPVPESARRAIEKLLPAGWRTYRIVHRVAGLGSLGRERYVAIAEYEGGKVAREAKAVAPSGLVWAERRKGSVKIRYQEMLDHAVRARDPFVRLKGRWIVRRLAPHCSRVELTSLPKERDESRLLYSMGFETANVHLGARRAGKRIARDLNARPRRWLHRAAEDMVKATLADWERWRSQWRSA